MSDHIAPSVLTQEANDILTVPEIRVEGRLKVTGQARYVNDVHMPGMLWADFLVSPHPHARIVSIDPSKALAVPGIAAIITGQDIGPRYFGRALFDWPVLAVERVRHVGERVAAVAGETQEAVEAALQLIEVVYEELPAVFDAEEAIRPDAPILHPDISMYHSTARPTNESPHPNAIGYSLKHKGDPEIERLFASAHLVVEDMYEGPRHHQGYIEPHGTVVWYDDDGRLQVITTNKTPFPLREIMAHTLEMPNDQIVVDAAFIGGDFGGKGNSIEEFACAYLAKATGRPIKAVMTYAEELASLAPAHAARYYLRTGVDAEGKIIAHETRAYANNGAYGGGRPNIQNASSGFGSLDVYNVPNARLESYVVYTNLVPGGNMRAPGAFHRGQAGEVHMDHLARELGMDPIEFRLRNCLREGDSTVTGGHVSRPRAVEVLETLRRETNWDQRPKRPNVGRGIALRDRHVGAGKGEVVFRLMPDGTVEALVGTADQGGGAHTVVQRVAAAALSVSLSRIRVRYGTTGEARWDSGAGGSRATTMVGRASLEGGQVLKEKLEHLAAEAMGWPDGQVRLEQDHFVVGDGSAERVAFEQVVARIAASGPAVEVIGAYDPAQDTHDDVGDMNFYAYMVEVEVDPETGAVTPTDVVVVLDVGTIINPIAHQGQVDGGFIYGWGQAVTEELIHENGTVTTLNLGEYKLPTMADLPPFRTIHLERDPGPGAFGAKAAGEITNTAVGGAIANAIYDAVGARILESPITSERVLAGMQNRTS
ncbi:MAG: xanthine dehydrogenase family protein molybdopterin-binding subunit [Chloroflexota bacterium]